MATSLIGPLVVERALRTAPPPRPPQPTRARRIMSSPAAWTAGTTMPESAVAAAMAVVDLRKSRRLDLVVDCGIWDQVFAGCGVKINRKWRERRRSRRARMADGGWRMAGGCDG